MWCSSMKWENIILVYVNMDIYSKSYYLCNIMLIKLSLTNFNHQHIKINKHTGSHHNCCINRKYDISNKHYHTLANKLFIFTNIATISRTFINSFRSIDVLPIFYLDALLCWNQIWIDLLKIWGPISEELCLQMQLIQCMW